MDKKELFNQICKNIKSLKIQGAKNIAKAGLKAYKLIPTKESKKKILVLRPTEPMLANILKIADKISYSDFEKILNNNQDRINKETFKLIKTNSIIFTHCHSSSVVKALIYSKKQGKKFEVYNTETRPLFQGRKTSKELKRAKIKVTMFIDSAAQVALTENTKKVDLVLFGSDALTKKGPINKIGSSMFAFIAKANKIPVYVLCDSMKYTPKEIEIEQRNNKEIWDNKLKINIKNPAFELIEKKLITGVISELGVFSYDQSLKKINKKSTF